jgi:hypothetical protein
VLAVAARRRRQVAELPGAGDVRVFTVVLVRRVVKNDRRPCNCFGSASSKRNLSIGSLLRNTWFLVLAIVATGAATMQEPSAVFATLLVGVAFAGVSAVLVVRT